MVTTNGELPGLIPDPKELNIAAGTADLGGKIRLVSEPSLQRILQEVLGRAGAQIGGDEGEFAIEARVEEIDLVGIPEDVREEAYELEVRQDRAVIRAVGRTGVLWGTQALAGLYRMAARGEEVPQLTIRDWPDLSSRGIFVEDKWGPDRMAKEDWFLVVDRLASIKMNRLGIGLYGCWGSCRFEGGPTEFLMVSVPGHPELKTVKKLRWYSPQDEEWHEERYLPRIFEEDFLGEVVAYGRERGVTVIPFVNSLGHNTMIPRLMPQIAAKDAEGNSLGIGYCLSNPQTREFIEGFYGSIVERYFSGEADFFHVQLDEVWPDFSDLDDPQRRVDPWCQCLDCRSREREEHLQEYIAWLVEMLTRKGVKKVVMWNDQLTRHMDALDGGFVQKLKDRGLFDRLILHWWWYSNEELNDRTRVSIGKKLGLPGWVGPMTCYFNWQQYSPRLENIELMLNMAHEEEGEGAVSYSVHDPGWADHEMLLASFGWNFSAVEGWEKQVEKWARGRFGSDAPRYLEAAASLRKAASAPALARCYHYTYTYCKEEGAWPRPYPGEALQALAGVEDAAEQLLGAVRDARTAAVGFAGLLSAIDGDDRMIVTSLQGEAARIEGLARTFVFLLPLLKKAGEGDLSEGSISHCADVRENLREAMVAIERGKPHWVIPATLQSLSVLLEFLDQFLEDLGEVVEDRRKSEEIRWHVER